MEKKVVTNAVMFNHYFGINHTEITNDFWDKEFELPSDKKDYYDTQIAYSNRTKSDNCSRLDKAL